MVRGQQTGQHITNNNNNIIRIIIKELGGNRQCGRKWDYLRQHLAVASLTERMGRSYISIYRFGEDGRDCSSPMVSIHHQAVG